MAVRNAVAGGRENAPVEIPEQIVPIEARRPINLGGRDPVPVVQPGRPLLGGRLGLLKASSVTTRFDRLNSEQRPNYQRSRPITSSH